MVKSERPQMAIWGMHFACWITMAIDTHLEYVILIAFPLQQWLLEPASVLCYKYTACLFISCCHLSACPPSIHSFPISYESHSIGFPCMNPTRGRCVHAAIPACFHVFTCSLLAKQLSCVQNCGSLCAYFCSGAVDLLW
jgi:hypothetical protein